MPEVLQFIHIEMWGLMFGHLLVRQFSLICLEEEEEEEKKNGGGGVCLLSSCDIGTAFMNE
jgi:hypothetical protein